MTINCSILKLKESPVPVVAFDGQIAPGSDGNEEVAIAFSAMSNELDLLASPTRQVIYDFVNCEYTFGDHLGGFFWVLPALLDGVAIVVAAQETNQSKLRDLANFIGSWLPIEFYDSMEDITESRII